MYGETSDAAVSGRSFSRSPLPRRDGTKVANKMPQTSRLSPESEALRRALRQDVLDVISMRHLDGQKQEVPTPRVPIHHGVHPRCYSASDAGIGTPISQAELFEWPGDGLKEEVSRLREAVDRLVSQLPVAGAVASDIHEGHSYPSNPRVETLETTAVDQHAGLLQHAEGKALVQYEQKNGIEKADEHSNSRSVDKMVDPDGSRSVSEGRGGDVAAERIPATENDQKKPRDSVEFPKIRKNPLGTGSSVNKEDSAPMPADVTWEWQRSNQGWAEYPPNEIKRIEQGFRNGLSRVRLKSGKEGRTPMEIFYVDMVQLDPHSGNKRSVRRSGQLGWWPQILRHLRALRRQVTTGEPRWESLEQYNRRQQEFTTGSVDTMWMAVPRSTSTLHSSFSNPERSGFKGKLEQVAKSSAFSVISMIVTILQIVWITIDTDRNYNVSVWDKQPVDTAMDLAFCAYFAIDLVMYSLRFSSWRVCFSMTSWCFDAICVAGTILEIIILPVLGIIFNSDSDWGGFSAIRALRLAKVTRVWRLLTCSADATPFFKGLLFGVRSAGFIWGIILAMTYVYAVLMRLYANDATRDLYDEFNSLDTTFMLLIVRGLMMDEVGILILDLWKQDKGSWFIFTTYTWFTFFNLLNMLVGTFCSVAGEVTSAEKDSADMTYLRHHLSNIVECYVHRGLIGKNEFELIMKNVDVSRICSQRGTDLSELDALKATLFQNQEHIEFNTFFQAITHLRKGKLATVKDILQVQETLSDKMERLGKTVKDSRSEIRGEPSSFWRKTSK
jgi:hypothetical protein